MAIKTIEFLPEIFQSTTNKKFLNATLDQLVSKPDFNKENGYIGRKFAPTFSTSDNYLSEPTVDRQNYQLEPSIVSTDIDGKAQFFSSYSDLLQQIEYYNGITSNQSRLFNQEAYTFDGKVNFDKLVNFSEYYWLPAGPAPVSVFPELISTNKTFTVTRNAERISYNFSGQETVQNPDIILARGGSYQFNVNQPGSKFWIQTAIGIDGTLLGQQNISTRDVFGVSNNGTDNGTVTFNVPLINAQNNFVDMPLVMAVDLATTLQFTDINNKLVSNITIDGIAGSVNLVGKYLIFVSEVTSEPVGKYHTIWQIQVIAGTIQLVSIQSLPINNKVFVKSGQVYANIEFYRQASGPLAEIPLITAPLNVLYYNDSVNQQYSGRILLVDANAYTLDINDTILGKKEYVSPNGITFTNGLKITFGLEVSPVAYAGNSYYVEGVGSDSGIRLVNTDILITPELETLGSSIAFDTYGFDTDKFDESLNGPQIPDYITINRSSIDQNAWSRSNRWFHRDIITVSAAYNDAAPSFNQLQRASRPIIEFDEDLLLSNYGRIGHPDVNFLDFTVTDALTQIEGPLQVLTTGNVVANVANVTVSSVSGIYSGMSVTGTGIVDGAVVQTIHANVNVVTLNINSTQTFNGNLTFHSIAENFAFVDGSTIIFANDFDPTITNKVFTVNVLNVNDIPSVHLIEAENGNIQTYDVVTPISGITVKLLPISDSSQIFNPSSRLLDTATTPNGLTSDMITGVIQTNIGLITGNNFWFNGSSWLRSQQKESINVAPLFDVVDNELNSFSDGSIYNSTSFTGCKIFSYLEGTGTNDTVLGFPITYQNFNNIGDIVFQNNFDNDTFTKLVGLDNVTNNVNQGFIARISHNDPNMLILENIWTTKIEDTKQYQIILDSYDGVTPLFQIDILPDDSLTVPNLKVFVNFKLLELNQYSIVTVGIDTYVNITRELVINDQICIKIYSSTQKSKLGYYEIPPNLEFNSLNQEFNTLTLGQLRNHVISIGENNNQIVGEIPGNSNLRDIEVSHSGGKILQHSAPIMYSSLFLINKELSFVDSVGYAQKEYTKFKNRFLESFSSILDANITDPVAGVDFILGKLNAIKNKLSPWYYSDMLPYGENYTNINYTVLNVEQLEYEINSIFVDTVLGNTSVLVYVNGVQLIKDIDYTFNQIRPTVVFKNTFNYNDQINFRIYSDTDGCFVPDTPTKLGLYPKFSPEQYLDLTYRTPITVIKGHDGSITPAFGDMRDALLLELEKRIYNNIKSSYSTVNFDIYKYVPGKFRETDYSITEFNQILSRHFLTWIGSNRIDYSNNQWFDSSNPWTWTYNKFKDKIDGEYLLGYWRGIYKYFYDSDTPNMHPWECLGFGEQPDWWESRYGPAPYTGGNLVLWQDLELGIIQQGPRAGTYEQYARPGLSKVIPVDDSGNLRPPSEFLVTALNSADMNRTFIFGDNNPVESAWRRSSDYPFALQQTLSLMKPGIYFGQLANTQNYSKTNGLSQFIISNTKQRVSPTLFVINGETVNGRVTRNAGYLNWIADYVTSYGADAPTQIRKYLNTLDVRLGYKVAGFTDQPYLTLLAEQSSPNSTNNAVTIPNENYQVYLHKSSTVSRLIYSAVIIEKVPTGYTVSGYSTEIPYFTIMPSISNNNQYTIIAAGATGTIYNDYQQTTTTIPYGHEFLNKQQVVDFLVSYGRFLESQGFQFSDFDQDLVTTKNWVLSATEFLTWVQQGWADGNIIVVSPVSNSVTVMTTNSVVDKITNSPMGSKVLDVGFNVVKNNVFTVLRDGTTFKLDANPQISIGLIDLNLVQFENVLIFDNETSFNDAIYQPVTGDRQYRLKYIGYKTNGWIGQLNPPGFIYSNSTINAWSPGQDYLTGEIVIYNSFMYSALQNVDASNTFNPSHWVQLDSSTFKTGMLPNLSYNAEKFENLYDVDNQVEDQGLNLYSMGLIGYRDRGYLDNLRLNSTSQVKFYQGFIKDKGTANAINALSNANFDNLTSNMQFYEEWAFRVGDYGATTSNQFVEVQLADSQYVYNPIALSLLNTGEVSDISGVVGEYQNTLYKKPLTYKTNIFKDRDGGSTYEDDIITAGYVNLSDVDATIFDIQDIQSYNHLIPDIFSGFDIWVAKDNTRDWNVYRTTESSLIVTNVTYSSQFKAVMTTNSPHNLTVGTIFAVRNFSAAVDGFYTVIKANSLNTVLVSITPNLENIMLSTPSLDETGTLFLLHSMRVTEMSDIAGFTPNNGWSEVDKLWVDSDQSTNEWAVYEKNDPWSYTNELSVAPMGTIIGNTIVYSTGISNGSTIATRPDGLVVLVGAPNTDGATTASGAVKVFVRTVQGTYSESLSLTFSDPDFINFGAAVEIAQQTFAIGAPGSYGGNGTTVLYKIETSGTIRPIQVISSPISNFSNANVEVRFGSSLSFNNDGTTLYIGAPGANTVYVYDLKEPEYKQALILTTGNIVATSPYTLSFTPVSTDSILISASSDIAMTNVLVPYTDYIVSGNNIIFKTVQTPGEYRVVQNSYYGFSNAITSITSTAGDNFGWSIKTQGNGSSVAIGAPNKTDTVAFPDRPDVGTAYLFSKGGALIQNFSVPDLPYSAKFGTSVTISESGKEVFIGIPGFNISSYHGGQVYRFTNSTSTYNKVVGYKPYQLNPIYNSDILINNVPISIPFNSSASTVLTIINGAGIAGLTATMSSDNYLTLSYVNTTETIRLTVFETLSGSLDRLGLPDAYIKTQTIEHPYSGSFEKFGSELVFDETRKVLLVGSEGAPTIDHTVIDTNTTIFDGGTLVFFDQILNTGAVYFFEELGNSSNSISNPPLYGFIQEIVSNYIQPGDNFGSAIAVSNAEIFIGANNASTIEEPNTGRIYYFSNVNSLSGWSLIRHYQQPVDIDSVTRIFLYDNKSETVLSNLDYIDPAKGKILGVAEQDISYKTSFDPATYNTGNNSTVTISQNFNWGAQQVGRIWWNLDSVRYINYEQDTLTYRINNWGKLFPGSVIEINEWVESSVLPSRYTGDGSVKHTDDSAYVIVPLVDPVTGNVVTKYYYWVTNKTMFDEHLPFRESSALSIANLISSPGDQDIPYAALIQNNSIALFNSNRFISDNNTILHIDYSLLENSNIIHNEYELIQENAKTAKLPMRIINKFIDSLTGADYNGHIVPDSALNASERYGISIRPRQTMFINRVTAAQNFVRFVNNIFLLTPIVEQFDLSKLYLSEPVPSNSEWDLVASKNISVASYSELSYLDLTTLVVGQQILVQSDVNYNNQWDIYEFQSNSTFKAVRLQNYQTTDYWSLVDWFDPTYDSTVKPTYTVATLYDMSILNLVAGDIVRITNSGNGQFAIYRVNGDLTTSLVGIQNGTVQLSDALWAHNTNEIGYDNDSFDTVKFDRNPTIEFRNIINALKDDIFINTLEGEFNNLFFMLLNYILSEQRIIDWAFKTSFVSIIHKLRKLSQFPSYIQDNQSYYQDYINEVKPYRTTVREYVIDYEGNDDANIHPTDFDLPAYYDTTLKMWRSPNGEQPGDAALLASDIKYADWKAAHTFSIDSVKIQHAGYGYSSPPVLVVEGGGGSGAILQAEIDASIGSVIGILVINPGKNYTSTPRIISLGDGVDQSGNQTFSCYPILTNSTVRTFNTTLKFDRVSYSSSVKQWSASTTFNAGDIVAYNNTAYTVNATITTGTTFVPTSYTVIPDNNLSSAADRVMAFYQPTVGMPGRNLAQLFAGTEYPGNLVDGDSFVGNVLLPQDANIQSQFTDMALGTRPEDINIVGGAFVDAFSSHAPEELLPGMIYDTLDIKVFTIDLNDLLVPPMGYRITQKMSNDFRTTFDVRFNAQMTFDNDTTTFDYNPLHTDKWEFRRISAENTTTLARDLNINDTVIYVANVGSLPIPSIYLAVPGTVYIHGERITYYTVNPANNSLGQIRRGVWGTGTPSVHLAGSRVVDASIAQLIPGEVVTSSWLTYVGNPGQILDGLGLMPCHTEQADFIRARPSYLPWLPGETGPMTDPNLFNTRFDDDGTGQINTPMHPFDANPFDSFNPG